MSNNGKIDIRMRLTNYTNYPWDTTLWSSQSACMELSSMIRVYKMHKEVACEACALEVGVLSQGGWT